VLVAHAAEPSKPPCQVMRGAIDITFRAMATDVRFVIGTPLLAGTVAADRAAEREREYVVDFAHRLSRFEPDSELTALNHDPRQRVPASALLMAAVGAGLWAAERSGGLVVPTLVRALEQTGYAASFDGVAPAVLSEALAAAPPRSSARPDPDQLWREIRLDHDAGIIIRPPGVMIDTGGTGKGLCADAVAHRLSGYTRFVIDCGGDITVGGVGAQVDPFEIAVEHPFDRCSIGFLRVARGGVATSGLDRRIWRRADGSYAHHLLDPSTGAPVWSGLISVTALAGSALEAETLSKMALLVGPEGAREVLAEAGGVLVHDSGEVEVVGPVDGSIDAGEPTR
jgi:FAD:protein FMN transferase